MSKEYMEIVVILDRSGSMMSGRSDHEGGLKSFVEDQKKLGGDVRFTLVQFDHVDPCEVIYDGVPIENVDKIELLPRGGTPLLDAIGRAVAHVDARIGSKTPDQVLVMIITDGEENESHEWTREKVKALIAEKEKKSWKFLYLGADVDAFHEARSLGININAAMAVNKLSSLGPCGPKGAAGPIGMSYAAVSCNTTKARNLKRGCAAVSKADLDACYSYTEEQRTSAKVGNVNTSKTDKE
jgi:uncharacterized protein YegL